MVDPGSDERLNEIINKLTEQVVHSVGETVGKSVADELSKALPRALKEGEFFRRVNDDMRQGFKDIYSEIKAVKALDAPSLPRKGQADKLFSEATDQLDEIMKATESATVSIMDIVEKHQDMVKVSGKLLRKFRSGGASKEAVTELISQNDAHQKDLLEIMTALSFQDLTGQRIVRIIKALKRIEEIVTNVYVTTGLTVKAHDESPDKDVKKIAKEVKKKASKLKGPQNNTSQADVDDLLSQLGL